MTKKLLLADDSVTIQRVIGIIFATEDYQLLVTDNGDDAYEKAVQELPDLVIADLSMPGKDGFELCRSLKTDARFAGTSVMLLPGTFDHFDEERALAVGADGWLPKPFESQALLDKVQQLLDAEPVRLTTAEAAPAERAAEDLAGPEVEAPVEPTEERAAGGSVIDESALGLDLVAESAGEPELGEGSAEDIWDTISFEEEELERTASPAAEGGREVAFEAAEPDAAAVVEKPFVDELNVPAGELKAVEDVPVVEFVTEGEPESLIAADTIELAEETEREREEPFAGFGIEDAPEAVLELSEELVEEAVAGDGSDLEPVSPIAEEEPLGLSEELAGEVFTEKVLDFQAQEEPILDLEESVKTGEVLIEVVAQDEAEFGVDEEILELAEGDILAEEPLQEIAEDFVGTEAAGLDASEEPVAEQEDGSAVVEQEAPISVPVSIEAAERAEEPAIAEEGRVEPGIEADEGFFFDASAAAEDEQESFGPEPEEGAAVAATGLAAGVVTTTVPPEEAGAGAPVEQVEQQLRGLSEDELKEVVAKVAGPMIEKLANQMLEQIVWEVVPDLAEAMIREEIRKLRQGVE